MEVSGLLNHSGRGCRDIKPKVSFTMHTKEQYPSSAVELAGDVKLEGRSPSTCSVGVTL